MLTGTAWAAASPEPRSPFKPRLFRSFFLGGFECSTQRRMDGRRLDLIAATRHDQLAASDYRQLARHGIKASRDGVRWHLVEGGAPGWYDWSPVLPLLRAAEAAGVQVPGICATTAGRTSWMCFRSALLTAWPATPRPLRVCT